MIESVVLLVSCGKHKNTVPCQAKDLYNSTRFKKLRLIAEKNNIEWYILSAKYGLLAPNKTIEPYDLCLTDCSDVYKQKWEKSIIKKLFLYSKNTLFTVIAPADYSKRIVSILYNNGYKVSAPFINKNEITILEYVQNANHLNDVTELYNCLHKLADNTGGIRLFKECSGKMYWPKRGVYFFLDFSEESIVSNGFPRIVRVGTHAVSKCSKTTLWHRLKTHKGTNNGGGNHRGSIFRLHVGNAIIKKEKLLCDTWGKGQNASKSIREAEKNIECLVSEYIGNLGVIVLDIDDLPAATSERAFVEKNSIALLSSINSSFNFSTLNWLGNQSPRNEIVDSCLWNINYINSEYDTLFIKKLWNHVNTTIHNYKIKKDGNNNG